MKENTLTPVEIAFIEGTGCPDIQHELAKFRTVDLTLNEISNEAALTILEHVEHATEHGYDAQSNAPRPKKRI